METNPQKLKPWAELLQEMKVSDTTGWRMIRRGWIKAERISGRLYVSQVEENKFKERAKAGEFDSHKKNHDEMALERRVGNSLQGLFRIWMEYPEYRDSITRTVGNMSEAFTISLANWKAMNPNKQLSDGNGPAAAA